MGCECRMTRHDSFVRDTTLKASSAYRVDDAALDLRVRKRHRMAQMLYRAPLADGITGFAAAAHHRNWSHRGGLGNNLVMIGLSVRR